MTRRNLVTQSVLGAILILLCMNFALASTPVTPLSYTSSPAPFSAFSDTGGIELIDGVIPTTNFMDAGWIGWYGGSNPGVSTPWLFETFDFGSNVTLEKLTIYGLNDPISGIGSLDTFSINYSTDGTNYFGLESFTATAGEQIGNPAAVGIYSRILAPQNARYVKVGIDQLGSEFSPYPFVFIGEVQFEKGGVVPEPGSLIVLGTGLMGIAGFVIRKRK